MAKERVYRAGGSDPRTGPERFMSAISKAVSPDRGQNRKWDDDAATVAKNKRKTAERRKRQGYDR